MHTSNSNARMRQPRSTHTRPPFGTSEAVARASQYHSPRHLPNKATTDRWISTLQNASNSTLGALPPVKHSLYNICFNEGRNKKIKNESLFFCSFPLRPKEPGLPCIQVCSPRRPPSVSRPVPQSMEGTRDGGPLKVRGCRWPLGGVMLQKAVHRGPWTSMRCRFWHRFRSSSKLKGYSGPGPLP